MKIFGKAEEDLPQTNTLAYFAAASVTKKQSFMPLAPGLLEEPFYITKCFQKTL